MADDDHRHVKSVSLDPRTKNRIRYAPAKRRAERASADVYRSYKRRIGVTSSASREERVHHPEDAVVAKKKKGGRGRKVTGGLAGERTVVIRAGDGEDDEDEDGAVEERDTSEEEEEEDSALGSNFASELDNARDRNASELFGKFHRAAWPLCRSLPELLHHADEIVDLLLSYMLSPESDPGLPSPPGRAWGRADPPDHSKSYSVNRVTAEMLHLLSVLARDLRHEVHRHVHASIVPRIVYDLLNPPPPPAESGRQAAPLDVTIVEAAFRALSYVFRYDSRILSSAAEKDADAEGGDAAASSSSSSSLEPMRQYYGATLGHRRDYVRRLAAETFAPLVRRLGSDAARSRHIKRVIRALASAAAAAAAVSSSSASGGDGRANRARDDAVDGVALLLFQTSRGAPGRMHSRAGRGVVRCALGCLLPAKAQGGKKKKKKKSKPRGGGGKAEGDGADGGGEEGAGEGAAEMAKRDATSDVARSLIVRLSGHLGSADRFEAVWDELLRFADAAAAAVVADADAGATAPAPAPTAAVDAARLAAELLDACVSYRGGRLLRDADGGRTTTGSLAERISAALGRLLERGGAYGRLDGPARSAALRLLRSSWAAFRDRPAFASSRLGGYFSSVAASDDEGAGGDTGAGGGGSGVAVLSKELLPLLPRGLAMGTLAPRVLSAAARRARRGDADGALELLHAVATARFGSSGSGGCDGDGDGDNDRDDNGDGDELFPVRHVEECGAVSRSVRGALLDAVRAAPAERDGGGGGGGDESGTPMPRLARAAYAARCIPFLCLLRCGDGDGEDGDDETGIVKEGSDSAAIKAGCKWIEAELGALEEARKEEGSSFDDNAIVAESLLLEALAVVASESRNRSPRDGALTRKALAKARSRARALLFARPRSLWAVRAAAAVAAALGERGMALADDSTDEEDETFDVLAPNLRAESHFLRLYTLRILNGFPRRNFVADHADLDLTGDLDEEPSSTLAAATDAKDGGTGAGGASKSPSSFQSSLSGPCDLLSVLLRIESASPNIRTERTLTSSIGRVEALGRSGRLPVLYAEAAANHMLGVFRIKFAPLWPAASKALVALASSDRGGVERTWPALEAHLPKVMEPPSSPPVGVLVAETEEGAEDGSLLPPSPCIAMTGHLSLCAVWETTMGRRADIFLVGSWGSGSGDGAAGAVADGRISRHQCTDASTVFDLTWGVMESAPQLTVTNSRTVVPIFLNFLMTQYYLFHDDDPDARELDLESVENDLSISSIVAPWNRDDLTRKSLQRKLVSFLKVFAAVNGPKQLFKHNVLLLFFSSQLSNPDASIAQLALSCVLKYKLPYVTPYSSQLRGLLAKGELRDTLTKFDLSTDGGDVESQHREGMIPILVRILFGRFSARGGSGAKSSKDSPAARRAAILSFLTTLGRNKGELDYFAYMMVRVFIPMGVYMRTEVVFDRKHIDQMIRAVNLVTAEDIAAVQTTKIEGFLNLLSDVISHLGYGAKDYVPMFIMLLLAICEYTESLRRPGSKCADGSSKREDEPEGLGGGEEGTQRVRIGNVRSLCFRRLSELLVKYASAFDFTPHSSRMWKALSPALCALPGSVVNAERAPALLFLLESLSSHASLISLLGQKKEAVEAVFLCIDITSRPNVIDCALKFIDNLLTEGGTMEDSEEGRIGGENKVGAVLIQNSIHLLISQFTKKLGSGSGSSKEMQLVWKELSVLCRVSELLVSTDFVHTDDCDEFDVGRAEMLEGLCSLLVPYLHFDRRISETNQKYVLGILSAIVPKIRGEIALTHLQTLSKLLGPNKAKAGISSPEIRQEVVAVIYAIASHDIGDSALKRVAESLECLCATHPKHIEEYDFERLLPVLNQLGSEEENGSSWRGLLEPGYSNLGLKAILPLMYSCFHMLYDSDGVVSRGALKALKTLISVSSAQSSGSIHAKTKSHRDQRHSAWLRMVETSFLSCVRTGLTTKEVSVRRSFVRLQAEVSKTFASSDIVGLHGDMKKLIREDDPECDFFLNISHIQVHRRARALNRLRKLLTADTSDTIPPFSMPSLTNVLLPLALHPVHECEKSSEEPYALEAIATVGAIMKHVNWNKYHSTLWIALNQLSRNLGQERYVVALICTIIDSFHFDVVVKDFSTVEGLETDALSDNFGTGGTAKREGNGVWRTLKNRLIPKIEELLVKESIESGSSAKKSLRSPVALALVKLFQKLPQEVFESKLPRVLVIICDALKSRDSQSRDAARETLAKMAASIGTKYLSDVIKTMTGMLSEGYQLHVRSAALHSTILAVSNVYERPKAISDEQALCLPFDRCVPALMDLIQQDIFGAASEMKEVQGVRKSLVKEASGAKSYDTLEIIARLIVFRPSLAAEPDKSIAEFGFPASAVHAVVLPLLERLRDPEVDTTTIGKVNECLNKIVIGFSHNASAQAEELLPFVYVSVSPFVTGAASQDEKHAESDDSSGEEDHIQVSRSGKGGKARGSASAGKEGNRVEVFQWQPSTLNASKDSKKAYEAKKQEKAQSRRVVDGASAPKLTGRSRYKALKSSYSHGLKDPASASAVSFGLSLLLSCLKKSKLDVNDERTLSMADPYIPMLCKCVEGCSDNNVILLSLRCLNFLLKMRLPSVPHYSAKLGSHVLKLLTDTGAVTHTKNETTQGCFKTISLLMSFDSRDGEPYSSRAAIVADSENQRKLPLDEKQLQILVSIIQGAITESEHTSPTFSLIKSITSKRYVSSEYYDLMETILKLSVQSQKSTVRQQCSQIFMQYFIDYPMGKLRLSDHLKQIVLNIKYEYEEGRLSAISLLSTVLQKIPSSVLQEHSQLFFLPLVLQLVNDDSPKCREAVAVSLSSFFKRLPLETLQSFYDYTLRWSSSSKNESLSLRRTSAQLFGIFVDSREDFLKRGCTVVDLLSSLQASFDERLTRDGTGPEQEGEWELIYFSLLCVEKLQKQFPIVVRKQVALWPLIVRFLVHTHPWPKQVASRIINSFVSEVDPTKLDAEEENFLVTKLGSLYEIARNLCQQLSADEEYQVEAISFLAIKTLTWVIQAMNSCPRLCFKDECDDGSQRDPVLWLMTRLSNIAKERGKRRREAVFKCFAAFASSCGDHIVNQYLEQMIEPLNRAITEASIRTERRGRTWKQEENDGSELPKEVLHLLEERCGTELFLNALASVKNRAREKKDKRKQEIAAEAVHDPQAYAKRKIRKQEKEKQRKKRKVQKKKVQRGAYGKKPRLSID